MESLSNVVSSFQYPFLNFEETFKLFSHNSQKTSKLESNYFKICKASLSDF